MQAWTGRPQGPDSREVGPMRGPWRSARGAAGMALACGLLGLVVVIGFAARAVLPPASLMLVFLVAVLVSAVSFGFWTGLASAALAFLAYNFFFVEPLYTFRVDHAADVLTLAVFLLVAGLTGFLAGRMREEADAAKSRAATLELLGRFAADLAEAGTIRTILQTMLRHLADAGEGSAVLLEPRDEELATVLAVPGGLTLDAADLQAAERALRRGTHEGGVAPGWVGQRFSYRPLVVGQSIVGQAAVAVLGYAAPDARKRDFRHREQAVEAIFAQGRVAIERAGFAEQALEAQTKADREALRAALLTSLSHDLRTPLATILGSVTSLRSLGETMPAEARADLLLAIEEEAGRLSRYVENLLQMTRLQAGLALRLDWLDASEIAHAAITRARRAFPGRRIELHAPPALGLIHADAGLLEQVLFNLLDNAIKFSPSETVVQLRLEAETGALRFSVEDQGSGIAPDELSRVFDPFFRGKTGVASGTGLGLAICKGIVQALGGRIEVESPVGNQPGTGVSGTAVHVLVPLAAREAA